MMVKKIIPVLIISLMGCTSENLSDFQVINTEGAVWDGPLITFEKLPDADPSLESSQDVITENVILTRGNDGGQIYNVKQESQADKTLSPKGTLWALGTLDNVEDLTFNLFRETVDSPKDVEGKELVMYSVEDSIYISVKFTSWSKKKNGGFAYQRSTKP